MIWNSSGGENVIEDFHAREPYSLSKTEKQAMLLRTMQELTEWHRHHCVPYQRFLDAIDYAPSAVKTLEDVPFLPIRAFKELHMKSLMIRLTRERDLRHRKRHLQQVMMRQIIQTKTS